MKWLWVLPFVFLAGCSMQDAAPAAEMPKASMSELSQDDMADLIGSGINRPYRVVIVSEEIEPGGTAGVTKIPFINNKTHFAELGYLRNPGIRVAVLTKTSAGKRIEGSDRIRIEQEAKEAGIKVWPDLRVEQILGPDGKTAMVLPNGFPYPGTQQYGFLISTIAYATEAEANEAKGYFGPGYEVTLKNEPSPSVFNPQTNKEQPSPLANHPWKLTIRGPGMQEGASDEMDEMERIANATDGKFVTTSFTE